MHFRSVATAEQATPGPGLSHIKWEHFKETQLPSGVPLNAGTAFHKLNDLKAASQLCMGATAYTCLQPCPYQEPVRSTCLASLQQV